MNVDVQNPNKKKFFSTKENNISKLAEKSESFLASDIKSSVHRLHCQSLSVFVATWNVGGKSPHDGINLEGFLNIEEPSDVYVVGFQEIVRLNAGNVLVAEDNEPAVKWLSSIDESLNQLQRAGRKKRCFKKFCDRFRTESKRKLKSCSCCMDSVSSSGGGGDDASGSHLKYGLVMAKQMVGIFFTIWARREVVSFVGHLRVSCTGRGIMGYLGNKGCISVSMTIHQTSLCFVCSHLTSGEKEGDELRRNNDVMEILKNTQFSRICRTSQAQIPDKILQHDRVLWLGDLNYRIALSYSDARKLVQRHDWTSLFSQDQLKIEREAGRIFRGWKEGRIFFPPTYKYSYDSDTYAGETLETKNKRRTPAWCDRILWRGLGIKQLTYHRLESRFSDHRPVCSKFMIDVDVVTRS